MTNSIFDKWNKEIDTKGLAEDVKNTSSNSNGNYVEVPHGTYEVKIVKAEVRANKNGEPMVTMQFKVLAGDYKGQYVWMNQTITQGFQIHIVNVFLDSLDTGLNISFEDYAQYNDLLMDITEYCDKKLEFVLEYGVNKKGFSTYEITDVFEVE